MSANEWTMKDVQLQEPQDIFDAMRIGPATHLRCYQEADGPRWEYRKVNARGDSRTVDLPALGSYADVAPVLSRLRSLQSGALERVLEALRIVAREPSQYGDDTAGWAGLLTDDRPAVLCAVMGLLGNLRGRALGKSKIVVSKEDWDAVQNDLEHALLFKLEPLPLLMRALATPTERGEVVSARISRELANSLFKEANRRQVTVARILTEALQERYKEG